MSKVFMLIGIPASGKSTWIENQNFNMNDTVIVSSDNYVQKYADAVGKTYNDVFKEVANKATKDMMVDLENAIANKKDVVWDQTNTTVESRRKKLGNFPADYEKIAVVFSTPPKDELTRRLNSRPGKNIPRMVINSMINNLQMPTKDEGFSQIINV